MRIDGHRHVGVDQSHGVRQVEQVLREMDQFGIDKTVVLPISLPKDKDGDPDARQAAIEDANRDFIERGAVSELLERLRAAREDNSPAAEAVRNHPDRLVGVFQLNPWLAPDALVEAEAAIRDGGFVGLKLHPMANGFPADHAIVDPVMELAGRLGVPVMFHACWGLGTEPWRIGETAGRFPDVNVVLYHAGVSGLDGRSRAEEPVRVAAKTPNVWLELSDAQPAAVRTLVDGGPPARVVFGSDAPFGNLEVQLGRTRDAVGPREKLGRAIFGENMARLLGLGRAGT